MRTAPVDTLTFPASLKQAEAPIHPRGHKIDYFFPRNRHQIAVTGHAARERPERAFQV
jgi:hypothetical protein